MSLLEFKKQMKFKDDLCRVVGHENYDYKNEWKLITCQRCGRDCMGKLNTAGGANWNANECGNQINLTVNGMTLTIDKGDVEVICMVLKQMV